MIEDQYQKILKFVEENNISVFDCQNIAKNKLYWLLENCFGTNFYDAPLLKETKEYFSDFKNNGYKSKSLEEDVSKWKYVFVYYSKRFCNKEDKEFFSTGFTTEIRFKTWLKSFNDGSINPVCLIIDGKLSKVKFTIEHKVEFKMEEDEE